jgi:hypothetical protein
MFSDLCTKLWDIGIGLIGRFHKFYKNVLSIKVLFGCFHAKMVVFWRFSSYMPAQQNQHEAVELLPNIQNMEDHCVNYMINSQWSFRISHHFQIAFFAYNFPFTIHFTTLSTYPILPKYFLPRISLWHYQLIVMNMRPSHVLAIFPTNPIHQYMCTWLQQLVRPCTKMSSSPFPVIINLGSMFLCPKYQD